MKSLIAAGCIAVISCTAFAQTTIETQRNVTTVQSNSGSVTTVQTSTVVRHYVSYLYDAYTAVNIPHAQIVQLIDLDLQILEARINLDFALVRVLVQRQVAIVGVPVVQRIHTYVVAHPVPAGIPVYAQPVWVNNVNVVNNEVNIDVDVNKTEIQSAVKQNNVSVKSLNIEAGQQAVKSGKIEQLKSGAGATSSEATGKAGAKGEREGTKPAGTNATPAPGESNVQPGETPRAGATPSNRGANPNPNAPPPNASDRGLQRNQSPNSSATPAVNGTATPNPTMSPAASTRSSQVNPNEPATNAPVSRSQNNSADDQISRNPASPSDTSDEVRPAATTPSSQSNQ